MTPRICPMIYYTVKNDSIRTCGSKRDTQFSTYWFMLHPPSTRTWVYVWHTFEVES